MEDIYFRQGSKQDLPEITALVKAAIYQMECHSIMQWDELYPTEEDFAADILAKQLYVGLIGDKIAVVYTLNGLFEEAYKNGMWSMPKKPFIILHRLCVHPNFQNQSVAYRAMLHMEKQAAESGIEAIRLDAFSQNPYALRLYQKCGYTKVGTANWRKGLFYLMEKYL